MLSVRNLVKTYPIGKNKSQGVVKALNDVSIDFPETGLVFLLGKSGSGKSTLLNSIGGLDTFDSGEIIIKGRSSKDFSQSDFDSYRNTFIGFIFQEYNILENFTVAKNLSIAIELQGKKPDKDEVNKLLEQVEMLDYAKRKPNQLSGGQKQRVAIARALIKNPEIIMADEPTGALDSNTGKQVMETLKNLSKTKLVIIVSHDREFAEYYGDRIVELKDGKIIRDVTRKEIEAEKTKNGVSVVDGRFIHIKQGQALEKNDYEMILKEIQTSAKDNDVIVSLNKDTNKTIKKAEFITDDGNKEEFLKTEPEDIKQKQYNGKSLKLIKSKLKFSDSFKMGTSALKNKVGKLVFTILLSFFAFTVFGIIDALSCWNRANSVYQALEITNQKTIVLQKSKKGSYSSSSARDADLDAFKEKFPNYTFKGAVSSNDYYSSSVNLKNNGSYVSKSTQNPYKDASIVSLTYFSSEDIQKFGFELEGRLPASDDEICVSKHVWENIKELASLSSYQNLEIEAGQKYYKIVGVVDDKTDLSKFTKLTEQELLDNSYTYKEEIGKTFAKVAYVTENELTRLSKTGSSDTFYAKYSDSSSIYLNPRDVDSIEEGIEETRIGLQRNTRYNYMWWNDEENRKKTDDEILQDNPWYTTIEQFKADYPWTDVTETEAVRSFITNAGITLYVNKSISELADDEIIIPEWQLVNSIANYQSAIAEGLYLTFKDNYGEGDDVVTLKVVGVSSNGGYFMSSSAITNTIEPLSTGYSYILTTLNGSSDDKELIKFCETYNEKNVKFAVQNGATQILDMLESIIDVMTSVFTYVAIAFAVFAALMLMNFISTSIAYKKREIGVLRALGARGSDIFGIFFNESTVIALINFALAAIATIVACNVINVAIITKLGYQIALLNVSIRQIALILAISWGSAFLASLIPTLKISKKKPIDAINNR